MKKLQRYDVSPAYDDSGMWVTERKDNTGQYCLSGDVSALEAENERLRRRFSKLSQKLAAYTFLPDTKFPAFENGKETGYWDAHEQIDAILNREQQEKP